MPDPPDPPPTAPPRPAVAASAYLLRTLAVDEVAALERRLVYDISGDPATAAVVVCDHPPGLTAGRDASAAHVRLKPADAPRFGPVRWVGRGAGVHLHLPGQVVCRPVVALDAVGLTPAGYVEALCDVLAGLARSFGLAPDREPGAAVTVRGRAFAQLGVAVRAGVTTGGVVVNVSPDLAPFGAVDCDGLPRPMTSLQRECAGPVRTAAVRQRLVELTAARLGFARYSVFHAHPFPLPRTARHAIQPARR